jgi:predicted acylesterase/phospholipase RssA
MSATARPERECDLVMKGGITSGVVYPGAITKISKQFRFKNLGGASAGAIAAVAAAGCEYARSQGDPDAFGKLDNLRTEITKQGFVKGLFQPTAEARPAFEVALQTATSSGSLKTRLAKAVFSILLADKRFLFGAIVAVLVWGAVAGFAVWALAAGERGWPEVVAAFLIGFVAVVVALLLVIGLAALALVRFATKLDGALKRTWWGMCSGQTEEDQSTPALTDWLYETVQRCAGNPSSPLTFAMLVGEDTKKPDVNLQLITTDLSSSRPASLPLPEPEREETPYYFDPDEWRELFPEAVVKHMVDSAKLPAVPHPDREGRMLHPVPGLELPIVVAARLSLSFPILLSTVPFWRADGENGAYVQHTMSDGGISSNFPIHYFDSLFPGRPTFGLDLQPWTGPRDELVEMSDKPRRPGFTRVTGIGSFFSQILNAARNWRDNMQAELPGYRDRICQIRLSAREGGLNLNMPAPIVDALVERGDQAGEKVTNPESFDWDNHRTIRFRTMMLMLQQGLGETGFRREGVYSGFREVAERWQAAGEGPDPPGFDWWETAIPASNAVFDLCTTWPDFAAEDLTPAPTLRIVPRA